MSPSDPVSLNPAPALAHAGPGRCPAPHRLARTAALFAAVAAAAWLTACGGSATEPAPPPGPPPAPGGGTLTIAGVAATGTALASQTVTARCAAGSGNATTDAAGAFSLAVSSGSLPCALKVTAAGGDLFSFALGSGSTATANITPFTHLAVAQAARQDPGAYYNAFDAATAAALTATVAQDAQDGVKRILAAAGLDVAAVGDWLTAALVASNGSVAGNAYALALDALAAALQTGGETLPTFTAVVVEQATLGTAPSTVASLPAALRLLPAAATCTALRSGSYRFVTPTPNAGLANQVSAVSFDATAMTLTRADGSRSTWAPNGKCRFNDTGTGWTADITVYQSGVWAGRFSRDGGATYRPLIALPEQAHAVADLAGSWQQMGLSQATSTFTAFTGSTSFDVNGVFTAGTECRNDATWSLDACSTLGAPALALFAPLQPNVDGGFDIADAASRTPQARLLAYRAGGGYLMLVGVSGSGFSIWTPQLAMTAPATGTVAYNVNYNITASLAASTTEFTTNTVTAQDATAGSWTRTQQTVDAAYTYVTTLFANRPRDGLFFRAAGTVLASDGRTTVTLNEFTAMRTYGMGFSPVVIPANRLMQLSGGVPAP